MKKFLFITPSFKSGGGIRVIIQIANGLVKRGYKTHIIYPNNSEERNSYIVEKSIEICSIGNFKPGVIHKLWNLKKVIRYVRSHYDTQKWVIIYSDPFTALMAFCFRGYTQWRFVQGNDYTLFDDLKLLKRKKLLTIYKWLTKQSYKYPFVHYMFNSRYSYREFKKIASRNDVKENIIFPGIDQAIFRNINCRNKDEFRIMTIGRKHGIKGLQYFIDAVNIIKTKIMIDEILVISQDDLTGFDLTDMKLIIPQNDDEINACYNRANIYVCTSEAEGFGLPAIEAMATGCCVVTTCTEGAKEYGVDRENCVMVKTKNVTEIANAIVWLYNNREELEKIAEAGYETSRLYSEEASVNLFLKCVEGK